MFQRCFRPVRTGRWLFLLGGLVTLLLSAGLVQCQEENGFQDEVMDEDMPSMLDRDDISYFFDLGMDELFEVLHFLFEQSARLPSQGDEEEDSQVPEVPDRLLERGSGTSFTTRAKLQHDLEQALYLSSILKDETESKFFKDIAVPLYQSVIKNMKKADGTKKPEDDDGFYFFQLEDYEAAIDLVYNKAWRPTKMEPVIDETTGAFEKLLNPQLEIEKIQRDWQQNQTVLVVDNFLSPTALAKIDQILTQSTVWFEANPQKRGHVTAAYLDDGLYDKLLLQLAYEIHQTLLSPMVVDDKHTLSLHDMWARKYMDDDIVVNDENTPLIMEPGDPSALFRLHLWLSNPPLLGDKEDGGGGQLVVFTAEPPSDWVWSMGPTGHEVLETLIEPSGFANVSVPFQRNRAVLFNAHLFHQQSGFQPPKKPTPYQHRRTDMTFLYGPSGGIYGEDDVLDATEPEL